MLLLRQMYSCLSVSEMANLPTISSSKLTAANQPQKAYLYE